MPLLDEQYILLLLSCVRHLYRMSLERLENMVSD